MARAVTTLINVDLNSGASTTYTGAAVLGTAGDFWNGINLSTGSPAFLGTTGLNYSDNTASGITIALSPFHSSFNLGGSSLMGDYAYIYSAGTNNGPVNIILSGFAANSVVNSIILFGGNGNAQNASFTIGAETKTTSDSGPIGVTLTENDEFVRFDNIIADGSGVIQIAWTNPTGGSNWSAFNGMQINQVPEPSVALLGALGLLGLLGLMRRRR
jgi:hypothetical protein